MRDKVKTTIAERWISRLKNHKLVAAAIVFGVVVGGIASFAESTKKLLETIGVAKGKPPSPIIIKLPEPASASTAQVLVQAHAYEALFREYKATRDELERTRQTSLQTRIKELEQALDDSRRKVQREVQQLRGPQGSPSQSVSERALAVWEECVKTSSNAPATLACSAILERGLLQR